MCFVFLPLPRENDSTQHDSTKQKYWEKIKKIHYILRCITTTKNHQNTLPNIHKTARRIKSEKEGERYNHRSAQEQPRIHLLLLFVLSSLVCVSVCVCVLSRACGLFIVIRRVRFGGLYRISLANGLCQSVKCVKYRYSLTR